MSFILSRYLVVSSNPSFCEEKKNKKVLIRAWKEINYGERYKYYLLLLYINQQGRFSWGIHCRKGSVYDAGIPDFERH